MKIEFDPAKDEANLAKHGLSLVQAADIEIIRFIESSREADNERRFRLYGRIGDVACCAVVTLRGDGIRVISLRRANRTERKRHDL